MKGFSASSRLFLGFVARVDRFGHGGCREGSSDELDDVS
jgi:hypothetical protein